MSPRCFARLAGVACFLTLVLGAPAIGAQGVPTMGQGYGTIVGSPVIYVDYLPRPPAAYARWYHAMEACTGLPGDVTRVQWYVTPRPWKDGRHGDRYTYGNWRPPHKIILNVPEMMDSALVSHEALHDILSYHPEYPDTSIHPPAIFDGTCAWEFHP